MEKEIEGCYRHIRNASRIQFLVNTKDIEDAGEEEMMMKQVAEEDEWQEDDEEDGSMLGEK